MPPFPRSEGLASAAASLFAFALTPCRRYLSGHRPFGHPYVTAAPDLRANAYEPRHATTAAAPGADAYGPRCIITVAGPEADALKPGVTTSGGRSGNAEKKQNHRAPAYPAWGRGKPVGGHPSPWRAGARWPKRRRRDRGSHQNAAGLQTTDECRFNEFPQGQKPKGHQIDECPRVHGAHHEPQGTQEAGKVCGSNARPFRDQVNCPVRNLDQPRADDDGQQQRKRKQAPCGHDVSGEPGRHDVSRGPGEEPSAGANSSDRLSKRQRLAEEERNHRKNVKQGLSRSTRRRMRRKAQKARGPVSATMKDLASTRDTQQRWKHHELFSILDDKHRAIGPLNVPNENQPEISAVEECVSGEVADVALPAPQDRESGNQVDDKFIAAFGGRMPVEAVDAALPASPKQEPGQPDFPTVAEETMKVESEVPGELRPNAVFDELAEETMAKTERKLPGHLKDLLDGRGSIPAHAGKDVGGSAVNLNSHDYSTLRNGEWLNDEVINKYLSLIAKRGKNAAFPKVHVFNTFFYKLLVDGGFDKVKRWTKKVNIFNFDFVFVPIHLGRHWVLGCLDMKNKRITYYDSFHVPNAAALKTLKQYVWAEAASKNVNADGWTAEPAKGNPSQTNESDCGAFTCVTAERISRRAQLDFTQEQMPELRRQLAGALFYGKV